MPGFGDTGKIDRSKYRFVWISFAEWERGKLPAVEGEIPKCMYEGEAWQLNRMRGQMGVEIRKRKPDLTDAARIRYECGADADPRDPIWLGPLDKDSLEKLATVDMDEVIAGATFYSPDEKITWEQMEAVIADMRADAGIIDDEDLELGYHVRPGG